MLNILYYNWTFSAYQHGPRQSIKITSLPYNLKLELNSYRKKNC